LKFGELNVQIEQINFYETNSNDKFRNMRRNTF